MDSNATDRGDRCTKKQRGVLPTTATATPVHSVSGLGSFTYQESSDIASDRHSIGLHTTALRNKTWANTVPVSKKEKSDKLHNWRAAGRAIRRMLTNGILPARSADPGGDATAVGSRGSDAFHRRSWSRSLSSEGQDGMNDMYKEFERSRQDDGVARMDIVQSKKEPENGLKANSGSNTAHLEENVSDHDLNGTLSSVLHSIGVTEDTLKPASEVLSNSVGKTDSSIANDNGQGFIKPVQNIDTEVKAVSCESVPLKDGEGVAVRSPVSEKRPVKSAHKLRVGKIKESINWDHLKERLSRLQISYGRSEPKNVTPKDVPTEAHKKQCVATGDVARGNASAAVLKPSTGIRASRTKSKLPQDGASGSSSEESSNKNLSAASTVKVKHKSCVKPKHSQMRSANSNMKSSTVNHANDIVTRESETSSRSSVVDSRLCSTSCPRLSGTLFHDNTGASSPVHKNTSDKSSAAVFQVPRLFSLPTDCAVNSSHDILLPRSEAMTHSDASKGQNMSCASEKSLQEMWAERPILTAGYLDSMDSTVHDADNEGKTGVSLLSCGDVACPSGRNSIDLSPTDQDMCKNGVPGSSLSNDSGSSETSTTRAVRKSTDDFAGSSESPNVESLSDSELMSHCKDIVKSGQCLLMQNEAERSLVERVAMRSGSGNAVASECRQSPRRRRKLVSMCSAADVTSSKENLAECCANSEDEMFMNASRRVTSSLEEEATLSDAVYTGGGIPRLVSSSSEEEVAAQIILEKYKKDTANRRKKEEELEPDFSDMDMSDLSTLDIPIDYARSYDDEEDEGQVELSAREIDSLPKLQLNYSEESSSGSEADDEFECECDMCQSNHLFATRNNSWVTEEEEETFGTESSGGISFQYHDIPDVETFDLDVSELNPFDLLVMRQGRRDILEVMFHNVILQMLAVYPELLNDQAPPPLDAVDLAKIPIVIVNASHIEKEANCPICLCEFEEGEEARQLSCCHIFHKLCVEAWLVKSGTCPVCRLVLNTKPAENNPP